MKIIFFLFILISLVGKAQITIVNQDFIINETEIARPNLLNRNYNYIGQQIYIPQGVQISVCQTQLTKVPIKNILSNLDESRLPQIRWSSSSGSGTHQLLDVYPESEFWTYIYNPNWTTYPNVYPIESKICDNYYTIIDYGIYKENFVIDINLEKEYYRLGDTNSIINYHDYKNGFEFSKYFLQKTFTDEEVTEIKNNSKYWNQDLQNTFSFSTSRTGYGNDMEKIHSIIKIAPSLNQIKKKGYNFGELYLKVIKNDTGDTCIINYNNNIVFVNDYNRINDLLVGKTFVSFYLYTLKELYLKNFQTYFFEIDTSKIISYKDFLTKENIQITSNTEWICEKIGLYPNEGGLIFAFLKNQNTTISIPIKSLRLDHPVYVLTSSFENSELSCIVLNNQFVIKEEIEAYNNYKIEEYNQKREEIEREDKANIARAEIQKNEWEKKYLEEKKIELERMIKKYGYENGTKVANKKIEIGFTKEMCIDALGKYYTVVYMNEKSEMINYFGYIYLHFNNNNILVEYFKK